MRRGLKPEVQLGRHSVRRLVLEVLSPRELMAGDVQLAGASQQHDLSVRVDGVFQHNSVLPTDVNGDQLVTALDALQVINFMEAGTSSDPAGSLTSLETNSVDTNSVVGGLMVDVNNDRLVSAVDALMVINHLNSVNLEARSAFEPVPSISIDLIERMPSSSGDFDFRISGLASADATVEIRQAGFAVAQTVAGADGSWSILINDATLVDSQFQYVAVEIDQNNSSVSESSALAFQPNIILVNADDMRYEQTRFMPFLQSLKSESTTFEKFYTPTSVSGPSRASLMTGSFAANHGYLNNNGALGTTLNEDRSSTLPLWMSDAGYRTGLFGKDRTLPGIDDRFETQDIMSSPPGWDDYVAAIKNGNLGFAATFTDNGDLFETGADEYINDVMLDQTLDFIEQTPPGQPFFAYFATNAPHSPGIPADRHAGVYEDEVMPSSPSFSPFPRVSPYRLSPEDSYALEVFGQLMESQYRGGSEALLSADEAIQALYSQLQATGQLDNSIIIFTADNGRGVGEHGNYYKNKFWEESIHVPLMVWDGRNPIGQTTDSLGTMADLTSTLLELGNASAPQPIDGISLLPSIASPEVRVRDDFLVQQIYVDGASGELLKEFGVHSGSMVYVETSQPIDGQDRFLFDLSIDIHQLNNLVEDPEHQLTVSEMEQRLEQLRGDDREAPTLEEWHWEVSGTSFDQPQYLTLRATTSDALTGGHQVRTPSLSYGAPGIFGSGYPLEASDGVFDSTQESSFHRVHFDALSLAVRPDHVFLATRDTIGNFSTETRILVPLDSAPVLSEGSDTGSSATDGVTLNANPVFHGSTLPGEQIALFAADFRNGEPTLLATTSADAFGDWSTVVNLPGPGDFAVYGQIGAPLNSEPVPVRFTAPTRIHLVAQSNENEVQVVGTKQDDIVIVRELSSEQWQFEINGIDAGTLPASDRVSINGDSGDDWLEIVGSMRSRLIGSSGDDTLVGGSGDDVLIGGRGSNELAGSEGNDVYQFSFSDSQIAAETIELLTVDRIREVSGQGTDRIRAIGNFAVDAVLSERDGVGQIKFPARFASERTVIVDDPLAIERIDGTDQSSQLTVPSQVRVDGGAGDDIVSLSSTVAPGALVRLQSLKSGGDGNDQIIQSFEVSSGSLSLIGSLPDSITVLVSEANLIEVQGERAAINSLLSQGIIQFIADTTTSGETTVVAISKVDGQAEQQTDELRISVADSISINGPTASAYVERGRNLRFAQGVEVTASAASFDGGRLDVSILGDVASRDSLIVPSQVPGPTSVRVIGSDVLFGDLIVGQIGDIELGSGKLSIQFNVNADAPAIEAIINRLSYRHLSSDPGDDERLIRLSLTNADGANDTLDVLVSIDLQNDSPTVRLLGAEAIQYRLATPRFQSIGYRVLVDDAETDFSGALLSVELGTLASAGESLRLLEGDRPGPYSIVFDHRLGTILVSGMLVGNFEFVSAERVEFVFNQNAESSHIEAVVGRVQYRNLDAVETLSDQLLSFAFVDGGGLHSETVSRTIRLRS